LPLSANDVDPRHPFEGGELLYRRVAPDELNTKGELDPTRIKAFSFGQEIPSCPSVMRSEFSDPYDVLHVDCAQKDVSGWFVYFTRVDGLPVGLKSGDGKRTFNFFAKHLPEPSCGAHTVIACNDPAHPGHPYAKPSSSVILALKVKLATGMRRIEQTYDIETHEPIRSFLKIV
jgi:hypothetical protein